MILIIVTNFHEISTGFMLVNMRLNIF